MEFHQLHRRFVNERTTASFTFRFQLSGVEDLSIERPLQPAFCPVRCAKINFPWQPVASELPKLDSQCVSFRDGLRQILAPFILPSQIDPRHTGRIGLNIDRLSRKVFASVCMKINGNADRRWIVRRAQCKRAPRQSHLLWNESLSMNISRYRRTWNRHRVELQRPIRIIRRRRRWWSRGLLLSWRRYDLVGLPAGLIAGGFKNFPLKYKRHRKRCAKQNDKGDSWHQRIFCRRGWNRRRSQIRLRFCHHSLGGLRAFYD